jgi:hypothetical protein
MGANEGITEKGAAFAKDEINSTVRDEIVEKMLARHLSEKVAGSAAGMIGILIDIATPEETAGPEADERPTFGYADFKPSGNIIEGQAYAPTGAPIGRPVKFPRGQIFH